MKIVQPWVQVLWPGYDVLVRIEQAGRIAYQSESEGKPEAFVAKLIALGHESVLEHVTVSAIVVCDRGVSHEIIRHRIASYTQESTRYCRYDRSKFGGQITVLRPRNLPCRFFVNAVWRAAMTVSEASYLTLLHLGVSPQDARSVLPNALKTQLLWSANVREWRHIIRLRTSPKAHPDMRVIVGLMQSAFAEKYPVLVEDIK
jgi:thymidylate synthase (FAD)